MAYCQILVVLTPSDASHRLWDTDPVSLTSRELLYMCSKASLSKVQTEGRDKSGKVVSRIRVNGSHYLCMQEKYEKVWLCNNNHNKNRIEGMITFYQQLFQVIYLLVKVTVYIWSIKYPLIWNEIAILQIKKLSHREVIQPIHSD